MNNNYAPQGVHHVGDKVVWTSDFARHHLARQGVIVRVIPYGETMELYKVLLDGDAVGVSALSTDFTPVDDLVNVTV